MNFRLFIALVKEVVHFEEEWDDDEWNTQYANYKDIISLWKEEYKEGMTDQKMVHEFAIDFYRPAKESTHEYWVK